MNWSAKVNPNFTLTNGKSYTAPNDGFMFIRLQCGSGQGYCHFKNQVGMIFSFYTENYYQETLTIPMNEGDTLTINETSGVNQIIEQNFVPYL